MTIIHFVEYVGVVEAGAARTVFEVELGIEWNELEGPCGGMSIRLLQDFFTHPVTQSNERQRESPACDTVGTMRYEQRVAPGAGVRVVVMVVNGQRGSKKTSFSSLAYNSVHCTRVLYFRKVSMNSRLVVAMSHGFAHAYEAAEPGTARYR